LNYNNVCGQLNRAKKRKRPTTYASIPRPSQNGNYISEYFAPNCTHAKAEKADKN